MKRIIAILLAALMLLTLMSGCKKNETVETPETETTFAPEVENNETTVPETEEVAESEAEEPEETQPQAPVKEEKPAETEKPAVQQPPKEEEPKQPEETAPVTPEPEKPAETPVPELPSETPILPPAAAPEKPAETTPETPSEEATSSKELTAIIDEIYKINDPILPAMSMPVDLSDAYSLSSFTGLSDASLISEAVASESMMGAQAYSLVLVRLKNAADAQTVAQAMRNGIDQRKWICVHADDIRVVAADDVVMLCMIASNLDVKVNDMVSAFASVMGKAFTADIS